MSIGATPSSTAAAADELLAAAGAAAAEADAAGAATAERVTAFDEDRDRRFEAGLGVETGALIDLARDALREADSAKI